MGSRSQSLVNFLFLFKTSEKKSVPEEGKIRSHVHCLRTWGIFRSLCLLSQYFISHIILFAHKIFIFCKNKYRLLKQEYLFFTYILAEFSK